MRKFKLTNEFTLLWCIYFYVVVKPGFHKANFDYDNDQFRIKTNRLVGRMTAQPQNRFVFCRGREVCCEWKPGLSTAISCWLGSTLLLQSEVQCPTECFWLCVRPGLHVF